MNQSVDQLLHQSVCRSITYSISLSITQSVEESEILYLSDLVSDACKTFYSKILKLPQTNHMRNTQNFPTKSFN